MIIDNGAQASLIIKDVHNGLCGLSGGKLSFQPNLKGKRPEDARAGLLNGEAIRLAIRKSSENPGFFLATFEPLT